MEAGRGKQKGSSFERHVCKCLSLWLSNGGREDMLWRSSMSGGRATVSARNGRTHMAQTGDISAITSEGEALTQMFVIECKHYANLNIDGILTGTGHLCAFWGQLKLDAGKFHKSPMLIAKQNRKPIFVVLDRRGAEAFGLEDYLILRSFKFDMNVILFDVFLASASRSFVSFNKPPLQSHR